ncbi:multidrug transporter [Pontibacillus halophilus JSM 076056 = DSM 19796]|uniref:Multidrug transporter n=1 Tax=Pontibacillus halophilus JSM 076056 = DSM 19796 TaxID=1385510 RepID=A0A0A5GK22_9BACI|nr:EamA family transporter [Pontibacillus halophilus]KGX91548.1 multidrug transporter [Pontibacillus halophilus JSM 076056 = DSM 19796]
MEKRLYAGLGALALIWGTSFLFIKLLVEEMGVWEVVFFRCLFGAIALWVIVILKGGIRFRAMPWKALLLIGLTNNTLPWGFIAISETQISSGLASILNATTPLMTALVGYFIFRRSLHKKHWLGIGVGFFGIFVLSDLQLGTLEGMNLAGTFTMLLASLCYGFSSQFTKRYVSNVSSMAVGAITLTFASIYSLAFAQWNGTMNFAAIAQPNVFFAFIGLGSFGSGIAIFIFYYLIQKGSAEFATMVTYLVPLTALLWGSVFLGESITAQTIAGLLFILAGVRLSTSSISKNRGKKYDTTYRVSRH